MKSLHSLSIRQKGFTLVELLVAMAISGVIAVAAISALIVSRQGFTTVDAASQLRDNARFATDLIQRIGVQTGFQDIYFAAASRPQPIAGSVDNPQPTVLGFNNRQASPSDPVNSSTIWSSTTALGYGSDVLILSYQPVESVPDSNTSDRSMIDCFGNNNLSLNKIRDSYSSSIFQIRTDLSGEPSLYCSTDVIKGPQPIIRGVENFQVLYGVDGVVANTALSTSATPTYVATKYLRADQMIVNPDPDGSKTNANWRRVRSIRVGMVLRGPVGSAQESAAITYYPLGKGAASSGGTAGSAMASTADPGTIYTPPSDTRLRQVVTFTIHLRNEQGLLYAPQ